MSLGLRGRFTLWFGVAALIPIAASAAVTREVLARRYRAEFDRELKGAELSAHREVQRLEEAVQRAVDGVARRQDPIVGGILVDLRKGPELSDEQRTALKQRGPETMRTLGMSVLEVVGSDDTVLTAPHFPGAEGRTDPLPRRVDRERPGLPVVVWTKVERKGAIVRVPVMAVARTVKDGNVEVTVLVGKELDAALVDEIERPDVVEARLTDATGVELATTESDWAHLAGAPSLDVLLPGPDGQSAAHLYVVVPDDDLHHTLRDVTLTSAALGLLALVGAVLLGFAISRRITRDLDALVDGAQAVTRGDLEHKVTVRARDEVGELATAFNDMTDELKESKERLVQAERVAAWQQIAQSIAHEIKNPLTPIQMSVETIRKAWKTKHPQLDEIIEDSTKTVVEEVARMKRIVTEFSQFARLPKPQRQPCDVDEIVWSAMSMYRGAVKVVSELAGALPRVSADRDQLTQVVLNLLENARDAVQAKGSEESVGRILVRTKVGDGLVLLEIEDNGPGFDPAIKDKLFTPYFTTKKTGTGLGLSIVHRIVTDHGGKISAQSDTGKGARFVVELPSGPAEG